MEVNHPPTQPRVDANVHMFLWMALFVAALWMPMVQAATVIARGGNVVLVDGERETRLTNTGTDKDPSLSPDGKWVIFVRQDPTKTRERTGDTGSEPETSIWIVGADGSSARQLIAEGGDGDGGPDVYGDYEVPQFLSDSRRFVFWSERFAVSGVVAQSDVIDRKIRLVCAGNSLEVIREGKYRDHLIVMMHRYWLGAGSYDWYWLVALDGTVIDPIGPNEFNVALFKEMNEMPDHGNGRR